MAALILGTSAAGAAPPTEEELTTGLVTTTDLAAFPVVMRSGPVNISETANETSAACAGPNNAARALPIDDQATAVGTALGDATPATQAIAEDAYGFSNVKAAKSFMKASSKQYGSCKTYDGTAGAPPEPVKFKVNKVKKGSDGDESFSVKLKYLASFGVVERQVTFFRVGKVIGSTLVDKVNGSPDEVATDIAVKKFEKTFG